MQEFNFCPLCTSPLEDKLVEAEPRRVCSADCGFIHYNNPTPVVAAVVEHEGRIVLARNVAWPDSWYGLITGFLERGESPEEGVVREVEEELSLKPLSANLIDVYPFHRRNQVIIAFHVPATGSIKLNHELNHYLRVRPENCYAWPSGTGLALRDWLRTRGIEAELRERVPAAVAPATQ